MNDWLERFQTFLWSWISDDAKAGHSSGAESCNRRFIPPFYEPALATYYRTGAYGDCYAKLAVFELPVVELEQGMWSYRFRICGITVKHVD